MLSPSKQLLAVAALALCAAACGNGSSSTQSPAVVLPAVAPAVVGPKNNKDLTGQAPPVAQVLPAVLPGAGVVPQPQLPPAVIPPPPPGADPRAAQRMTEYTSQRIGQGYVPYGSPGADSLARTGASREYELTLNAGDCYTLAAFGGAGVRDLDIYLVGPNGHQVAQDVAVDSRPIVNTCVQETGSYRVRILMYDGHGPFTYQVYQAPGAAAQAVGIAGIDAAVRRRMDQQSGRYVSHGFRAVPALAGAGTLGQGQTQSYTVPILQTGSCYAFVGYAGSGMRDLDIYLYDPQGNQVRRDVDVDAIADVKHFVTTPGAYRIALNAYAGGGAFAYQVYVRQGQACN